MRLASVFCPSFSTISVPLGIVYVNTRLAARGHEVHTFDFELYLDLVDPTFNTDFHRFVIYPSAEEEENGRVLFINRLDTLLETLYGEPRVDEEPILAAVLRYAERFAELLITRRGFDTVLLSTYNSNLFFTLVLAKAIKRRNPSALIILGGPAVSFPTVYQFLIATRLCDYCVVGEGEDTIAELVDAIERQHAHRAAAKDSSSDPDVTRAARVRVPGVAYWNGLQVSFQDRPKMDLAHLDQPRFDDFPFAGARPEIYATKTGYFALPISASRGCTLRCAFCAETNFWESFRKREPRAVVEEMAALSSRYRSRIFHVCDSLINADPQWLDQFCDALLEAPKPGPLINFAYSQARNLDEGMISKMAEAGFRGLNFGVESGSDPLLKKMHKATKGARIKDILLAALRAGMNVDFPLLRNLPGETREDVWNTLTFVSELEDAIARDAPSGGLTYSADTNFRLEAMSGVFRNPAHYGITLEHFEPELPPSAEHLRPYLRPMFVRWQREDVSPIERRARSSAMASLRRVSPTPKYGVEECLEWVDLRHGYVLGRGVDLSTTPTGAVLRTRFGEYEIGEAETRAIKWLDPRQTTRARVADARDPRVLSSRFGWAERDVSLLIANLLSIGAVTVGGSPHLLGEGAWFDLLDVTEEARPAPWSS